MDETTDVIFSSDTLTCRTEVKTSHDSTLQKFRAIMKFIVEFSKVFLVFGRASRVMQVK